MNYRVVMSDGVEIIGKVFFINEDKITLEQPVLFMDLFSVDSDHAAVWHTSDDRLTLNRNNLSYEYEPSDLVVEIYEAYTSRPEYKKNIEILTGLLEVHRDRLALNTDFSNTIDEVITVLQNAQQKKDKRKLN